MEYNKEEIIKEFKDWSKFKVQGIWKDSIEKLLLEFIEQSLVKKLTLTDVSKSFYCERQANLLKQCAIECDYCKSIRDI